MIVETGRIPLVDQFSFTMTRTPYDSYAQFWLAELLLYLIYGLGGLKLLVAAVRPAVAGVLFALVLGLTNWSIRPQGLPWRSPLCCCGRWCGI